MTEEQAAQLKPGDKIKLLYKSYNLSDGSTTDIAEVTDPTLFLTIDEEYNTLTYVRYYIESDPDNEIGYSSVCFIDDCELVSQASKKCSCDLYKVIMVSGCQCGGQ